jgi:hypothetical protein
MSELSIGDEAEQRPILFRDPGEQRIRTLRATRRVFLSDPSGVTAQKELVGVGVPQRPKGPGLKDMSYIETDWLKPERQEKLARELARYPLRDELSGMSVRGDRLVYVPIDGTIRKAIILDFIYKNNRPEKMIVQYDGPGGAVVIRRIEIGILDSGAQEHYEGLFIGQRANPTPEEVIRE